MTTYQLRPMSVGEILDGAFVLLRRHFGALFTVTILCLGVPTAVDTYLQFAYGQMAPLARPGLTVLSTVLKVIGYLLVSGATVRIVSEAYLGRVPAAGEALRFAVGRMWGIFLSGLAVAIAICFAAVPAVAAFGFAFLQIASGGSAVLVGALIGVLLLVLPILVATAYAVVVQSVVLEQLPSSLSALGRSWALTKGYRRKAVVLWLVVLALLMLFFVAVGVVSGIFSVMSQFLGIVAVAAMSVLLMMVYPLMSCVFTLLYYDLRVRKEAFDLELLSQQIGLAPTGA